MVNIRLNEFDRKILANIKPSDKWNKFKNIFVLNSEIQKLKIGSSKVGTKCSQHLRKLSNKNIVTLEEIRDGCKDLIPKKHKHGFLKFIFILIFHLRTHIFFCSYFRNYL